MSDAKVYSQPAKGLIKETGAALQILISGGREKADAHQSELSPTWRA